MGKVRRANVEIPFQNAGGKHESSTRRVRSALCRGATGLHARGASGGHRHHRGARWAFAARRAGGTGVGSAQFLSKQPQAGRAGDPQSREHAEGLSCGLHVLRLRRALLGVGHVHPALHGAGGSLRTAEPRQAEAERGVRGECDSRRYGSPADEDRAAPLSVGSVAGSPRQGRVRLLHGCQFVAARRIRCVGRVQLSRHLGHAMGFGHGHHLSDRLSGALQALRLRRNVLRILRFDGVFTWARPVGRQNERGHRRHEQDDHGWRAASKGVCGHMGWRWSGERLRPRWHVRHACPLGFQSKLGCLRSLRV